jgi:hypothetical protein
MRVLIRRTHLHPPRCAERSDTALSRDTTTRSCGLEHNLFAGLGEALPRDSASTTSDVLRLWNVDNHSVTHHTTNQLLMEMNKHCGRRTPVVPSMC